MASSTSMARKHPAPSDDGVNASRPMYFATARYKQWVRDQLKKRSWTEREFAKELKRIDVTAPATGAGLHQFLGNEGDPPIPSNTTLMPAINKLFKIAPPPICDPLDPMTQLRDRFLERWAQLSERERRGILAMLGGDES